VIAAGKLDRQIRLELAGVSKDPNTREELRTWPPAGGSLLSSPWAERLAQTGREFDAEGQRIAEVTVRWRIHWSRDVVDRFSPSEDCRVLDERGLAFDVLEVREPEGTRRSELLIFGKARVA
jgi:head-tail adaptor